MSPKGCIGYLKRYFLVLCVHTDQREDRVIRRPQNSTSMRYQGKYPSFSTEDCDDLDDLLLYVITFGSFITWIPST